MMIFWLPMSISPCLGISLDISHSTASAKRVVADYIDGFIVAQTLQVPIFPTRLSLPFLRYQAENAKMLSAPARHLQGVKDITDSSIRTSHFSPHLKL